LLFKKLGKFFFGQGRVFHGARFERKTQRNFSKSAKKGKKVRKN